jgi:UDPglucose 6-dehydrogenase
VDIDETKVNKLKNGKITIYEPGLEKLFERNLKEDRLQFTTNLKQGLKDAEIVFLALPTPPGEDGSADLRYVLGVAEDIGKLLTDYKVIIDKSTVPVGTAEKVHSAIAKNSNIKFDVVSNPEFLREGFAVDDFLKPDRVVIGTSSEKAKRIGATGRPSSRTRASGITNSSVVPLSYAWRIAATGSVAVGPVPSTAAR